MLLQRLPQALGASALTSLFALGFKNLAFQLRCLASQTSSPSPGVLTDDGRLDDIGQEGMGLIGEIREIFDNYGFNTQILAASIRHTLHVIESARLGADICTCPAAVIESMFRHPLTDIGLEKFLKDWEKAQAVKA